MNREEAALLLHSKVKSENLRRHCYSVEAVMRALAERFGEDKDTWGIAGLLHDADYEETKDNPDRHTHLTLEWLGELQAQSEIGEAIAAHGWGYVHGAPEPKTPMQWALFCSDELTGFIVAVALVKPDRKLASVSEESIMKKWKEKSFAAGVDRGQIEKCEEKLGIELSDFIEIALESMQAISDKLGL